MRTPTIINENKSVLFISNSPEQFTSAVSVLEGEGYQVLFEKEANQGLKTAKARTPEMIVTELAVPNIDGLEVCYRVREESDLGTTPVLLIGDLSRQSEIVADGIRCGASDYLQKPFGDFDLIESIRGIKTLVQDSPDENIFDSLINNAPDLSFVVNDEGTILVASESTECSLGYHPSMLTGRSIFDLIHKSDSSEMHQYLDSMFWEVGEQEPIDYRIKKGDGNWALMESNGSVINDLKVGTLIVLTSREPRDKALGFERAIKNDILRNALFENASVGIAIFSPSGRLVRSNPALLDMLDHSENELCDSLLAELVFPRDPEKDKSAIVELTSGKLEYYKFDNGYIDPRGERVWGALTLVAIPKEGDEEAFLIGIFEEPTAQWLGHNPKNRVESPFLSGDGLLWSSAREWEVDRKLISEN